MLGQVLLLGTLAGLIHFMVVGALYGNPIVDRIYKDAQKSEPGVRKWPSQPKYLITQFLGTQVEVYILALAFVWLCPLIGMVGLQGSIILGLMFAALRVYPRFWNMWIQSTYPRKLLKIEFINGIVSTLTVVVFLHFLVR